MPIGPTRHRGAIKEMKREDIYEEREEEKKAGRLNGRSIRCNGEETVGNFFRICFASFAPSR
jgi:hypothetical protein